jgi:hypothetical protein
MSEEPPSHQTHNDEDQQKVLMFKWIGSTVAAELPHDNHAIADHQRAGRRHVYVG